MKKILFVFALIWMALNTWAQVTNEGHPKSWDLSKDKQQFKAYVLPEFDVQAMLAEDEMRDKDKSGYWRFGKKFPVDLGFEDGKWLTLDNGDRIWRIKIHSPGALTMNVIFDEYELPAGASVYLYNDDHSDLLGAYTSVQNQESKTLATWLVQGDTLWIEYYEPAGVKGQGKLHIGSVTHGYRNAQTYYDTKGFGDSGDCNHDVNCPIGDDFTAQRDHVKKSVGIIMVSGQGFCSGALINNTANDGTPYFLTANHCVEGTTPANWVYRFGWISPINICGEVGNSAYGPTNMTLSGSVLRAKNATSDFCLVELNNDVPAEWDRVFAGWDRSDDLVDFVVGIHHPNGDVMKICRDDTGPVKLTTNGTYVWMITTGGQGWELGVTEPGSSGSPLFDPTGRIIGQLYAGQAACNGTNDNGQYDIYGRFAVSWDTGSSNSQKLRPWLDPQGTNPESIDSYPPFYTSVTDIHEQPVEIYPNPVSDALHIKLNATGNGYSYSLVNILGQSVTQGHLHQGTTTIPVKDFDNGVYFLKITGPSNQIVNVKKIVIRK